MLVPRDILRLKATACLVRKSGIGKPKGRAWSMGCILCSNMPKKVLNATVEGSASARTVPLHTCRWPRSRSSLTCPLLGNLSLAVENWRGSRPTTSTTKRGLRTKSAAVPLPPTKCPVETKHSFLQQSITRLCANSRCRQRRPEERYARLVAPAGSMLNATYSGDIGVEL